MEARPVSREKKVHLGQANETTMSKDNKWKEELDLLRSILDKTGLEETTKWGVPVFTYNGTNIVSFNGFKNHVALVFFNGFLLKDPFGVLINAQEGKTKAMRQWRFTAVNQIDGKKIQQYVAEAVQYAKEGKQHKPERQAAPALIPPMLAEALKSDRRLKTAFDKLAPYQQKLYAEHIDTAKQEATKAKRLDKIRPMILQGIGLHDKYKNG